MRLFQAPLNTCLGSPILCQPLSSRFALHGLRGFDTRNFGAIFGPNFRDNFGNFVASFASFLETLFLQMGNAHKSSGASEATSKSFASEGFRAEATSKKSRVLSGRFSSQPSNLPISPSISFSSREAGLPLPPFKTETISVICECCHLGTTRLP